MAVRKRTITQLRAERDMTQMQLAVKLGVSLSGIQSAEYGWSEPKVRLALKIAEALGVTVEEIDWLHNPKPRPKETPRVA
jgi:DNA-binding XRE family transcriptional regulator